MASANPFERIRSTEGKVFLLLLGLALLIALFDFTAYQLGHPRWLLVVEILVASLYIVGGTWGTMRVVAKPVRRAVEHFKVISEGDYRRPVLTRRTDEFGDMLRALDGMRLSLAAAVRKQTEAEQRYRDIVEQSVHGFYQSTPEGDLLGANEALAQLLGFPSVEKLLAQPRGFAKHVHVDPARRELFNTLLEQHGAVVGFETALRRADGGVVWVSESGRLVRDGRGRAYAEGFVEDITARKDAEQLKADFVSFVTHQLRTPLSGIRWMLELARDTRLDPETDSYLRDALLSAERLIGLVNDLLDIARLEAGRLTLTPSAVNLNAMVGSVVAELRPLADARGQRVELATDATRLAWVDAQLARQAVLNLVSNAIKYTPDAGTISVTTRAADGNVVCAVHDTGIGISSAAQKRLFEKFYRAENAQSIDTEGTGLGLYLVKLIAERSGGSIACESIERHGSTFTLTLPAAADQEAIA